MTKGWKTTKKPAGRKKEEKPSVGLDGSAQKDQADEGPQEEVVFGQVEGLTGTERTLQDILNSEEEGTTKFEIPDFLK